jgi:cell wall-associated NlpC family hydrolase
MVTGRRPARPARRLAARTALTALAALTAAATMAAVALAGPATASPRLADAKQRAATLRSQVDRQTLDAEVATEDYNGVQTELTEVITRRLLAQRQLSALQAGSADDQTVADKRVRAIYMTGGSAGLLSSVLGARDLGDAVARVYTVQNLVGDDQSRIAAGTQATGTAAGIAARLGELTTQKVALEQRSRVATERVQAALTASQRLLAAADATVRSIAAADRRAAEAAAARAFATQLSAAQAAAGYRNLGPGTAPSARATMAVAFARTRLGAPYVWGATGPNSFDCSGLTGWSYLQAGLQLPRTSRGQWYAGPHVELAGLAPGDLLFWATDPANPASIHHVALYIGGGLMIAAPQTGDVVKIQAVYLAGYIGAVRPAA